MLIISGTVAFISSFMQNIGAAALLMPATKRICRQTNIPVSRILMPMGFLAIIGGCITLIGSSPLILLNDVMKISDPDAVPFGLFAVTPVGLALVAAGLLYFLFLGRLVLPSGQGEETGGHMSTSLKRTYQDIGSLVEIHIPESFEGEQTLAQLEIRPHFFVTVVGIAHSGGGMNFTPMPDDVVGPGDVLAVNGAPDMISKLAKSYGWEIKQDLEIFAEQLSPNNAGIMEVIISPRSDLTQRTIRSSEFRRKYGVNPLALFRGNKTYVAGISTFTLETGDALLLQGRWEKFHFLKQQHDLIFTEDVQGEILRTEKIKFAVGCLLLSLSLILLFHVQLSIALLTGALGMVLTRVLSIDEAYQSVDWMTVFLLGGLIPLGIAFEKTGTAKVIAETIMSMMGSVSPLLLLTIVGLLTSFFTLVVNALGMGPGGYRTIDYFKAGSGMTVLYLVVMMAAIYIFYGISA